MREIGTDEWRTVTDYPIEVELVRPKPLPIGAPPL